MTGFPNTLSFRMTLGYTLSFFVFLSLAFSGLYFSISTIMDSEMEDDLIEDIEEFRLLLKNEGLNELIDELENEVLANDAQEEFIKLVDSEGNKIFTSDLSHWKNLTTDTQMVLKVAEDFKPVLDTISIKDHEYETKIIYGYIGSNLIMHLGESLEQKEDILELIFIASIIMFCLVVPVSSFIGWILVKRSASGISEVSNAATDLGNGKLGSRVSISEQHDEIQNLADTFNAMAERIQKLMSEMRELTDNIAHDLRSPLGRIRVNSEMALSNGDDTELYRNACAETIEECDRLIQMINMSLDVAEAEAGVSSGTKEQVNLSELTEDACELFEPVAEDKSIELAITIEPEHTIYGNKQSLQRMIANVLDNALKYTPAEGKININVTGDVQEIVIKISDTGIGIPESDQQRVFDRFYRCDQSRTHDGCGLGLSYSRAVARANNGDITLISKPDEGTSFSITFPTTG